MATSLRDMALSRDNHTCQECGATPDKLHVHHLAYGTDDPSDLITLCPACHQKRHKTRPPRTRRPRMTAILSCNLLPEDAALLDRLAARYGMTESGLIRWAIRYLDEHGPLQGRGGTVDNYTRRMDEQENAMLTETDDNRPTYMWTSDRTRQVDYVRELASELISSQKFVSVSDYADAETYAEAIVTDYLERMAEAHEPMPDWWDAHDRGLLARFVENMVATDDPDEVEYGI